MWIFESFRVTLMSTYEKYVWRFTVTVRKIASILTVIALMALVGCSSTPKGKELKSTVKFEILEHKGSVLGQETSPAWGGGIFGFRYYRFGKIG